MRVTHTPAAPQPEVRALHFTSLQAEVEHRLEIQRSVFLTRLVPVATEEAARAIIEEQRRAHHDARHHCSAFVLGADREVQRSSDDGEPSGTAGVPMMQALLQRETVEGRRDLSDVVAVTTRWFGGILLGAGGLVRAYSDSVSQAVAAARLRPYERVRELIVVLPMAEAGRGENVLRHLGPAVLRTEYTPASVEVFLGVADTEAALAAAKAQIEAALQGGVNFRTGEAAWAA